MSDYDGPEYCGMTKDSTSWNDFDENVVITDGWAEERHECQCGKIVDGFEWRTWGSCYDCYDRATNPARWYE